MLEEKNCGCAYMNGKLLMICKEHAKHSKVKKTGKDAKISLSHLRYGILCHIRVEDGSIWGFFNKWEKHQTPRNKRLLIEAARQDYPGHKLMIACDLWDNFYVVVLNDSNSTIALYNEEGKIK